jgi:uncharacterized membrane protein
VSFARHAALDTGVPAATPPHPALGEAFEVLAALGARYPLPRKAVADFCAGMRQDLARETFATEADVDRYCYRVAGTVGLVMTAVLGASNPWRARPAAVSLGIAMQRTNMLRDIDEDAANGRVYVAQEAVRRHGSLQPGRRAGLLYEQIAYADALYERGLAGVDELRSGRGVPPRPAAETRAVVVLMLATSTAEALEARGRRGPLVGAVAGAVGFAAEVLGVATGRPFGRYAYSDRLGPRVRGVPVLAAAAWALLARPAWVVAGRVSTRRALRVPLAAGGLTAWDVFLDPRMAREGYWTWPDGGAYEGVPASNFVGWFATGLAAFAIVATIESARPDDRDDGALALYAWTWAGESFANAALWRRPLVAGAGAVAMGAFAVPALWSRSR